eukprot:PhM_4_TR16775/c0_g1_i1/m.22692
MICPKVSVSGFVLRSRLMSVNSSCQCSGVIPSPRRSFSIGLSWFHSSRMLRRCSTTSLASFSRSLSIHSLMKSSKRYSLERMLNHSSARIDSLSLSNSSNRPHIVCVAVTSASSSSVSVTSLSGVSILKYSHCATMSVPCFLRASKAVLRSRTNLMAFSMMSSLERKDLTSLGLSSCQWAANFSTSLRCFWMAVSTAAFILARWLSMIFSCESRALTKVSHFSMTSVESIMLPDTERSKRFLASKRWISLSIPGFCWLISAKSLLARVMSSSVVACVSMTLAAVARKASIFSKLAVAERRREDMRSVPRTESCSSMADFSGSTLTAMQSTLMTLSMVESSLPFCFSVRKFSSQCWTSVRLFSMNSSRLAVSWPHMPRMTWSRNLRLSLLTFVKSSCAFW